MSNINAIIDDLAHPNYPKRFCQNFDPMHNLNTMTMILKNEDLIWTLSSRGIATIWYTYEGKQRQVSAEAPTPEEAMCRAYITMKEQQIPKPGQKVKVSEVDERGVMREVEA